MKKNVEIKNIGLVVSPRWPFPGCSPDGIVWKMEFQWAVLELNGHIPKRM